MTTKFPMQPIHLDPHGVARFRENRIVSDLLDAARATGFDLNKIACGDYTQEEHMQLAQLIGYSVSGYGDLSYASKRSVTTADKRVVKLLENK